MSIDSCKQLTSYKQGLVSGWNRTKHKMNKRVYSFIQSITKPTFSWEISEPVADRIAQGKRGLLRTNLSADGAVILSPVNCVVTLYFIKLKVRCLPPQHLPSVEPGRAKATGTCRTKGRGEAGGKQGGGLCCDTDVSLAIKSLISPPRVPP